jgi:hypothetical protein
VGPWWYPSFEIACGGGGASCAEESLQTWVDSVDRVAHGIFAPCGSVRIDEVRWQTGARERGAAAPPSLTFEFTLNVYNFAPKHPPGSPECEKVLRE